MKFFERCAITILNGEILIGSEESVLQLKRKVLEFLQRQSYGGAIGDFFLFSDQKLLDDNLKLNTLPIKCFQGVALRFMNRHPSPTKIINRSQLKRHYPTTPSSSSSAEQNFPERAKKDLSAEFSSQSSSQSSIDSSKEISFDQSPPLPVFGESNGRPIRHFCLEKNENSLINEYFETFDRIFETFPLLLHYSKIFPPSLAEKEIKQRLLTINRDLKGAQDQLSDENHHNLLSERVSDEIFNFCCKLIRLTNVFEAKITKNMNRFDQYFSKFTKKVNDDYSKFKSKYERFRRQTSATFV